MGDNETGIWRLATALSASVTPVDVAVALAEEGAAAAGATFSNMAVYDGPTAWVIHGAGLGEEVAERWSVLSGDPPTPLHDAITGGRPVFLGDIGTIAERYPALEADTTAAGLVATASLPLVTATGEAAGAAGFGWPERQSFDDDQKQRLDLIAQLVASALERTVLHRRHTDAMRTRDVADAQLLQDVFLPRSLPDVAGLEIAAVYLPASEAPMGGDWYDVFPLPTGATCLVIGDVGGHGLEASAVMAQLRNAVRAYAVEHADPAVVMERVNEMLCLLEPSVTATVIVAMWDPASGAIVRCNAGHPAVLRCRSGEVGFLHDASNVMLGVQPGLSYTTETKQLRPGTTLLLFTDGLVERRAINFEDSLRELARFVEKVSDQSPRALCESVTAWRLDDGHRDDDICVLAVRLS